MLTAAVAIAAFVQIAASQPSAQTSQVAERLAKATSLPDSELFVSVQTNLPPARRAAFERAMAQSQADAAGLRSALAAAYARHLTSAEMQAAVAFFESPLGASFERKSLMRRHDSVSSEEMRAVQVFAQTPAGSAFGAKEQAVNQEMLPVIQAFGDKVASRAQAIHCRATNECGPFFQ